VSRETQSYLEAQTRWFIGMGAYTPIMALLTIGSTQVVEDDYPTDD